MRGKQLTRSIADFSVRLYLPPNHDPAQPLPTIYFGDGNGLFELLGQIMPPLEEGFAAGTHRPCILVGLQPRCRDDDYTPWPAPGFDAQGPAFGGGAHAHIAQLVEKVLPQLEAEYGAGNTPHLRCIAGISLSGLMALYALYDTPAFDACISISGSNWYEGLLPYLQTHRPQAAQPHIFLSYGRREGSSKYSMHKDAAACTIAVHDCLCSTLGTQAVTLHSDNGKHYDKRVARYTAALQWYTAIPKK